MVMTVRLASCLIIKCNYGKLRNFFDKGSRSGMFEDVFDFLFYDLLEREWVERCQLRA